MRVHGRQRKTRVVKKVTSCVFDDVLHFPARRRTTAAAEAAAVYRASILDHGRHLPSTRRSGGRELLGLRKVHALADHEFYRKWVGARRHMNPSLSTLPGLPQVP